MSVTFLANLTMVTRSLEAKNQLCRLSGVKCASHQQKGKKWKVIDKNFSQKRMTTYFKGKIPPFIKEFSKRWAGERWRGQREQISLPRSLRMLKMSHVTVLPKKPQIPPVIKGLKNPLGMQKYSKMPCMSFNCDPRSLENDHLRTKFSIQFFLWG